MVPPAAENISEGQLEDAIERYERNPYALIRTSRGLIDLELYFDIAPLTVLNFIELVRSGFYDGLSFHRVVPDFVVQGGDPRGDGWGGPPYFIRCEYSDEPYRRGTVGIATSGKDTGGSQFFLTHLPTYWLNPNKGAQSGHTVFGRIVKGVDVAAAVEVGDRLVSAKILRKRNHEYKPKITADEKPNPLPKGEKTQDKKSKQQDD